MSEYRKSGGFGNRGGGQGGFKRREFGGRPSFGGRPDWKGGRPSFGGGNRNGGQTQMFSATCAQCQKSCEVPFRPNGEKPVYCKDCFVSKRENPSTSNRESFQSKPQSDTRTNDTRINDVRIDELKRSIEVIGDKLDRLTKMIENRNAPKESAPVAIAEETVKRSTVKKKSSAKKK